MLFSYTFATSDWHDIADHSDCGLGLQLPAAKRRVMLLTWAIDLLATPRLSPAFQTPHHIYH